MTCRGLVSHLQWRKYRPSGRRHGVLTSTRQVTRYRPPDRSSVGKGGFLRMGSESRPPVDKLIGPDSKRMVC